MRFERTPSRDRFEAEFAEGGTRSGRRDDRTNAGFGAELVPTVIVANGDGARVVDVEGGVGRRFDEVQLRFAGSRAQDEKAVVAGREKEAGTVDGGV